VRLGYNVIGMLKTSKGFTLMTEGRKGFTLIELLITMTIIAILSGVGVGSFMGSQKRGRDIRRQSDLNQYRIALENYASVNGGVYPSSTYNGTTTAGSGIFSTSSSPLASYISGFPADPQSGTYYYVADASGLNYVLQACMESTNMLFQFCSNGKSGSPTSGTTTCATGIGQVDATCDL
jgi:prepilin-type N-terminal cleavage/methylation domain-containing protein